MPSILPTGCPPVVRMMVLRALLLLSTLARTTDYLLKIFRLRRAPIGPVIKSLLDIPVNVCVANRYILRTF